MNHFLQRLSGWLAGLLCLGILAFSSVTLAASDDTLGPGDSIKITVLESPDLTTEARLSAQGVIRFPLLGEIKLGGLTPTSAAEKIARQLTDGKIIRNPQINVTLVQMRSQQVSVLGEVGKPGRYVLDETRTTVTDLLAQAGGIGATGDSVVTVIRTRDGVAEKLEVDIPKMYRSGNLSENVEVANGDTIFVRKAPVFYIYGQIQKAGTYRLESDMTVMQALTLGGGLTVYGTERGIKISRRAADGTLAKYDAKLADRVKADDIIYIQESFF